MQGDQHGRTHWLEAELFLAAPICMRMHFAGGASWRTSAASSATIVGTVMAVASRRHADDAP